MGWIATATPETLATLAAFEAAGAASMEAGEVPDALLQGGAIHLNRHRKAICRAADVSQYANGLSADQVEQIADRVRAPDLRRFLRVCVEHRLGLRFLQ